MDAWCHLREDLRSFSLDAFQSATLLEARAKDISEKDLDAALASGYGIFSGKAVTWATLRFSPTAALWVMSEEWHPEQREIVEPDGHYRLEIPYSDDRELVMDILKHGADIEVLAPKALRERIRKVLTHTLEQYR